MFHLNILWLGITACSFTYPLDVVRSRLAFQVADEKIYCGVCHVIRQIVTTEGGFTALYRGYGATALAMIPAVGECFKGHVSVLFVTFILQLLFHFFFCAKQTSFINYSLPPHMLRYNRSCSVTWANHKPKSTSSHESTLSQP